jgi:hypothetical protein
VVSVIAISARYRFPQYTRATFQAAAGGIQAPAWNPAYPIKDWFDPGAVAGVDSTYQVMNGSDMLPALITLTIPGAEALTVNLPGTPTFSAYVVAPTLATKQTNFARMVFAANPVDPGTLATLAQANTLAAVAGATVVDPTGPLNQFLIFSWNGETRRPYVLMPPGATGDPTVSGQNVGQILASVNAAGVAAPGHWDPAQLALHILAWVPETAQSGLDVTARVPEPMLLNAGETLVAYQVGILFTPVILAAGETLPGAAAAGAQAGDGFGAPDRTMLTAVYDAIKAASAA